MSQRENTFWGGWNQRVRALSNIPPLIRIVWESGRAVVAGGMICRVLGALVPVTMLAGSKRILDGVQAHTQGRPLPAYFWYLVAAEFLLAAIGSILGRAVGYFDALLADRFPRHVSVRVMEH